MFERLLAREPGRAALFLPVVAMVGDASFFGLRHNPPIWLGAALLAAGGAALLQRRSAPLYAAGLAVALFGFGFGSAQLAAWRAPPFPALPSHAAAITGRIVDRDVLPDGVRLELDQVTVAGQTIGPRHLRLHVPDDPGLQPGARISLRGIVAPPSPPAYPGGRDLQRDAYFSGLAGNGYSLGAASVTMPAAPGLLGAVRARIADRIRRELPGPQGAIAATLLTGLSAAIPPDDRDAFRDAGLAHLLAIAGLHIGIVMGLALAATRFALLLSERVTLFWPVRQIAALAALAAGLAYLLITGLHVPTLRSFAMASLAVLALLAGRRAVSLRNWGLAALVVIAAAPEQITGPSFQLSFAAVLALIAGYEALREKLTRLRGLRWGTLAHHAATLALTSLLAGVASLPFIAYHFGRIQLYFVAANVVAVPLTALWVMPAGLLGLALMPLGLDWLALAPMGWGIGALLWIAHCVAAWPAATVAVPHVPLSALLAMAAGLAWLCLWRTARRWLGLAGVVVGVAIAALTRPPDLLVSADSRLVGLAAPQALYLRASRGGDAYVQDQWMQYLGSPTRDLADAPPTLSQCNGRACTLLARGAAVAVLGDSDSPCTVAPVFIAQSGAAPYCPGMATLDRGDTWRDGAIAVWGSHIATDRDWRGDRPWVFLPPEQERAGITLPMAKTEPLP
jgi:competence protein ComEC